MGASNAGYWIYKNSEDCVDVVKAPKLISCYKANGSLSTENSTKRV